MIRHFLAAGVGRNYSRACGRAGVRGTCKVRANFCLSMLVWSHWARIRPGQPKGGWDASRVKGPASGGSTGGGVIDLPLSSTTSDTNWDASPMEMSRCKMVAATSPCPLNII